MPPAPCCNSSPDTGPCPFAAAAAAATAARRSELGPGPAGGVDARPLAAGTEEGPGAEEPAADRVCRPDSPSKCAPPKRVRPRVGPNRGAAVSTCTAAPPSLADQMRQVPSRDEDRSASGMQLQKSMKVTAAVCPSSTDTGTPSWPSCRSQDSAYRRGPSNLIDKV